MSRDWRKRALLALALASASAAPMSQTQPLDVLPYPRGLALVLPLAWLSHPVAQGIAFGLIVLLLIAFVADRHAEIAAVGYFCVVLALHSVVRSMHSQEADHTQGAQMPCSTLLAWSLGGMLARRLGRDRDQLGGALACGVVAAGYTMAALSKLRAQGLEWIDGRMLALLIYERGIDALGPLAWLRELVGTRPQLCALGMTLVLAMESCGVLFAFRKTRTAYAIAVVTFHASSALLLGYSHVEWALTVIAWAWATSARADAKASSRAPSDAEGISPAV